MFGEKASMRSPELSQFTPPTTADYLTLDEAPCQADERNGASLEA